MYHVGVHLFETGKPWTFYIRMPKASVHLLMTSLKSDHVKGISRLFISPPDVGIGTSCNPYEFFNFLQHINEIAEKN